MLSNWSIRAIIGEADVKSGKEVQQTAKGAGESAQNRPETPEVGESVRILQGAYAVAKLRVPINKGGLLHPKPIGQLADEGAFIIVRAGLTTVFFLAKLWLSRHFF